MTTIRPAAPGDIPTLLDIYAPYVTHTAISFELSVPSQEEFARRLTAAEGRYPFLVAEVDGVIQGYAYLHPFIARAAYDHCAETTIYLRRGATHRGLGKRLYAALEAFARAQNIANLYACVGVPEEDDEYLDHNSVNFHSHLGYTLLGTFHHSGRKFGRWYHMVWMEKLLLPHRADLGAFLPLSQLDDAKRRAILEKC